MNVSEKEFEQIVREHKSTIYSVCYMFADNADEVADLFQEALVNIWNGLRKFDGRSGMKTWIYRVTLNTCISADRKRKAVRHKQTPDNDLSNDSGGDHSQIEMLPTRLTSVQPFYMLIVL